MHFNLKCAWAQYVYVVHIAHVVQLLDKWDYLVTCAGGLEARLECLLW